MAKGSRKGGLTGGMDPGVAAWQRGAATNEAALSRRQRYDRERVRVRVDAPQAVAAGLEREAATWETSQTQLGAFLLAWSLHQLHSGNALLEAAVTAGRVWSKAINVKYDMVIPEAVLGTE
jgi:hypothetical protein